MITAIAAHILRLLTFRHDGRGLPNNPQALSLWALIVIVSALVAWARWDHGAAAAIMLGIGCAVGWYTLPLSTGYALISIGVDVVAMATGLSSPLVAFWEVAAVLALVVRMRAHFEW